MSNPPTDEEIADWVKTREKYIKQLKTTLNDLSVHHLKKIDLKNLAWQRRVRDLGGNAVTQMFDAEWFNEKIKRDQDLQRLQKDQDDHWAPVLQLKKQIDDKEAVMQDEFDKLWKEEQDAKEKVRSDERKKKNKATDEQFQKLFTDLLAQLFPTQHPTAQSKLIQAQPPQVDKLTSQYQAKSPGLQQPIAVAAQSKSQISAGLQQPFAVAAPTQSQGLQQPCAVAAQSNSLFLRLEPIVVAANTESQRLKPIFVTAQSHPQGLHQPCAVAALKSQGLQQAVVAIPSQESKSEEIKANNLIQNGQDRVIQIPKPNSNSYSYQTEIQMEKRGRCREVVKPDMPNQKKEKGSTGETPSSEHPSYLQIKEEITENLIEDLEKIEVQSSHGDLMVLCEEASKPTQEIQKSLTQGRLACHPRRLKNSRASAKEERGCEENTKFRKANAQKTSDLRQRQAKKKKEATCNSLDLKSQLILKKSSISKTNQSIIHPRTMENDTVTSIAIDHRTFRMVDGGEASSSSYVRAENNYRHKSARLIGRMNLVALKAARSKLFHSFRLGRIHSRQGRKEFGQHSRSSTTIQLVRNPLRFAVSKSLQLEAPKHIPTHRCHTPHLQIQPTHHNELQEDQPDQPQAAEQDIPAPVQQILPGKPTPIPPPE